MKGAQVTVKTRAKNKRKNAVAPPELEKAQDELEDPLAEAALGADMAHEVEAAPAPDPESPGAKRTSRTAGTKRQKPIADPLNAQVLQGSFETSDTLDADTLAWLESSNSQPAGAHLNAQAAKPAPGLSAIDNALDRLDQSQNALDSLSGATPMAQEQRAQLTMLLLSKLTQGLGVGNIPLRTDASAQQRLSQVGTKGLMEQGQVLLDPEQFDPSTEEGRRLLAHELVHVAQERLPTPSDAGAGARAELEASVLSRNFAASGAIAQPMFGLPSGHIAADGDLKGMSLGPILKGYHGEVKAFEGGLGKPVGPTKNKGSKGTKEDRKKKVSRYEDGVDGIADEIGDLSAFADLCDTIEEGPSVYMKHMHRIEKTESFSQLAEMWQGAKDGGPDSQAMKKVFNHEFDDRGFWAETEKSFDLVQSRAKKAAKRREQAKNAASNLDKAKSGSADVVDLAGPSKVGGKGAGVKGKKKTPIDPALAELMNATVTPVMPKLGGLPAFLAVQPDTMGRIESENNHAAQFSAEHGGLDLENSRLGLVLEQYKGAAGNFGKTFVDGMVDDQTKKLGGLADKKLTGMIPAAKGLAGIMPVVTLAQTTEKMFTGETWTKKGDKIAGAWAAQEDKLAALNNDDLSTTDRVGLWISIIADYMDMAGVVVSTASDILGFIQDLLYVLGAIALAVGLALIWFFGVGVPFVTAGLWMLETATALQPAVKALGLISYVLLGVATAFRTAAVFMVPGEFLAAEAAALGASADAFAEKSGTKVANKTNKYIKNKKDEKTAEKKAQEEAAASGIQTDSPKTTLDAGGTESGLQDKMKNTVQSAQDKTAQAANDAKNKSDAGGDDTKTKNMLETAHDTALTSKNKMAVGEVKTAKDGRIYTYAEDGKGNKQLMWGTKGGDPSELDTKVENYNTGSGFFQKQWKGIKNAEYTPDKLKNKQVFSFLKSTYTYSSNLVQGKSNQLLTDVVPALTPLKRLMPNLFATVKLIIPRLPTDAAPGTIALASKTLTNIRSELSSAASEVSSALGQNQLSESELGVVVAMIQAWEEGIEKAAVEIESALADDPVAAESPKVVEEREKKRKNLEADIKADQAKLASLPDVEPVQADNTAVVIPGAPAQGSSEREVLEASIESSYTQLQALGPPGWNHNNSDVRGAALYLVEDMKGMSSAFAPFKGMKAAPPKPAEDPGVLDKVMGSGSAGGAVEVLYDEILDVKTDEEIEQMANRTVLVEAVNAELPAPALFDEMVEHQMKAAYALSRYKTAHALAYTAYSAELAMADIAGDTDAMIQMAGPMRENIEKSRLPLEDAKTQENQREAALANITTETPGMAGWIAGLIIEIMTTFMDNEDAFDGKSSAGDTNAGADVVAAGNGAGDSSKQQKEQTLDASKKQNAFVDAASQVQQEQLISVNMNIEDLRRVQGEEMDTITEFQLDKAGALAERENAQAEFVLHSGAFVLQEQAMESWAGRYKQKREDLENGE